MCFPKEKLPWTTNLSTPAPKEVTLQAMKAGGNATDTFTNG